MSRDEVAFSRWLDGVDDAFTESVRADTEVGEALVKVRWRVLTRSPGEPKRPPRIEGEEVGQIVAAAREGDRHATERLLTMIFPLMVRFCRGKVGRQLRGFSTADDVAQEVCIAVFRALPSYRDQGGSFLAFVYGIARHKVADAHRSAARDLSHPVSDAPDGPDAAVGPERTALHGELTDRLARLLRILPDRQREILLLRVVVGLSAEETAAVVDSTPGAVRVAQHRALAKLRAMITDEHEE